MPPRLVAVLLAAVLPLAVSADPTTPADPALNPRGRAILTWFQQLSAAPELRLVSGQFIGWSGEEGVENLAKIHRATGRWPAMIGVDYCRWIAHAPPDMPGIDTREPNEHALAYWRDGGLVTISWHAPNPTGESFKTPGIKLADLLVPGPLHDRWMASLDQVAAGLAELQAAGVVVLWRPLHEMNGGWFWWGAQPPADFIAVWRHMFDYFTREKQLHNLLWVYGPNNGQKPVASYYPGDTYVDLTGLDAYTDHIDPQHIAGFPGIIALGKPAGLAEFGPHAAAQPPGNYDFRRLLDGIEHHFPQLRHFLCWDKKWNPAENRFAREFYNDERVISRDELPAGLAGPITTPDEEAKRTETVEAWRARRLAALLQPDGWLTLIGRHPLDHGTWSVGSAEGSGIRLAAGPDRLGEITYADDGKVTFALADGVEGAIDGTTDRRAELAYTGDEPTFVHAGPVSFYIMDRSGHLFLRVRDRTAARLREFAGLDSWPVDPAWRIEADWVPYDPPRQVTITNIIGLTEPADVPGKAVFTHDGRTYELLPLDEGPESRLFFILTDTTAGTETYEACRFLYADRPVDGKIILDFNRVYNPPCAFTPFATCPLPPKENILPFALRAGEKKYRGEH